MANLIGAFALSDHLPEGGSNRSLNVALLTVTPGPVNNGNGPFEVKQEDLEHYADSLRNMSLEASFDYDHSFLERSDSKAAGWIVKDTVRVDGDKVLADVEWTPKAAAAIRDKEYRYVSPEFIPLKRDEAGEITQKPHLRAAGLTNRPFLKTLGEIALSDKTLHEIAEDQNQLSLVNTTAAKRLADHFGVDVDAVIALAGGRTPEPKPSQEDDMSTLKDTAKALGLSEDADQVAVTAAIQALNEKAQKAPTDETIQKLTAAAEAGVRAEKKLHEITRATLITAAIKERKVLPVQRESLEALYDLDPEKVEKMLTDTPAGTFAASGSGEGGEGESEKVETATAKVDGVEMEYDVDPEALHEATLKALKESGRDKWTDAEYATAGRKVAAKLRA